METFVVYNLKRPKKKGNKQKPVSVEYILGLRHVPDDQLMRALRQTGISVVNGSEPVALGDILDKINKERER